jgi:adenosylcobinamide-GDP ribazoletransferase
MKMPDAVALRQRAEELGLAVGLLTRFPLPAFEKRTAASNGSAFWAYPLVGAVVGVCAGATFWLAVAAGFGTTVAALLAIAAMLLAGGGLHEDGLSDFWDGLGGGRSRAAKLAIMRDSRVGTYGALALFLTLALQVRLLVDLHYYTGPATVAAGLIAAEAVARGAIALPVICLAPAREDGLGRFMTELNAAPLAIGIAISAAIAGVALGSHGLVLIIGGIFGAAAVVLLAWRFLNGFTGDVLGATAATARLTALAALTLAMTP